ncbi:MAG: serine/threonine-protein kinase, partial [Vicinamibacteria bacterium]
MGAVYEAYEESMQRTVALKVLSPALQAAGIEASRFEREAWIGGRLAHPNVVKVYGQGADGALRYIALELIRGPSLHEALQQARERRETHEAGESEWRATYLRSTVELFVGVADALYYVHEQGVLHRDIKPANLLLSEERDRLFLTDFGLARDTDASRLTRRGDFFGTIRYMSPEQLLASTVDLGVASDIYSLGV